MPEISCTHFLVVNPNDTWWFLLFSSAVKVDLSILNCWFGPKKFLLPVALALPDKVTGFLKICVSFNAKPRGIFLTCVTISK